MTSRIASLSVHALDVRMKKPFGIAGGAQERAANVLVEVVLSDGAHGLGEGAPFPAFNGETQDEVLAACGAIQIDLEGCDADATDALRERLGTIRQRSPSAVCAIETAVVDARARRDGRSLVDVFGGAEETLLTDITITTGTVEEAGREARAFVGFSTLKIKVGGGDLDQDVARVRAVRQARPEARILVDANGGFSLPEALAFAEGVRDVGVALFEQPIAAGDWPGLAEVRAKTKLRIALDESITCAADVDHAAEHDAADAINAKIMKSGIFEVLAIAERARIHGLSRMIGGMVETRLAMGTSACIAAGLGGFSVVDLDTPLFLAEDPFVGGYAQDGERIDLRTIDCGHGLSLRV